MKIQGIHLLYIRFGFLLFAKTPKSRILYVFFTFGLIFDKIVHRLSTEYINIWYSIPSLDTIYPCR